MFRQLANPPGNANPQINAATLVTLRPSELTALLELAWNNKADLPSPLGTIPVLGIPDRRSNFLGLGGTLVGGFTNQPPGVPSVTPFATLIPTIASLIPGRPVPGLYWHHLIYAYMIENTRIYEIFRRVVFEYLHGEKLGVPSNATQLWLRNTEELFYRAAPPFFIGAVESHIRADLRASRRNAYQRMFGMDLNHGNDDNTPYTYLKAEAANNEFVSTFEELLREVWIGIVNLNNSSGVRAIDDAKIENLSSKLHDMLMTRRLNGNLSREEFAFVSMMSWFHLTVESDLPIIGDLKAEAGTAGPEQRLFKIAQRVGLPAHGLSKSYFDIADAISAVLILVETGLLNASGAGPAFYNPLAGVTSVPITLPDTMKTIITHWTAITGRDVKAGKVAAS